MGENPNQIESEIRETREQLGRNLDELEDRARELADWRTHYRNHSGAFLGAAFVAGAAVALAVIPQNQRGAVFSDGEDSHDAYAPRFAPAPSSRNRTVERFMQEASDTWGNIADALLRTASAKVMQVVSELVPGMQDHVGRRVH